MADPHPPAHGDDKKKADEHAPKNEKKEEKKEAKKPSFVATLVKYGLYALAIVVFLYYLGPIVGMGFDGLLGIVTAANNGMRQLGGRLIDMSQAVTSLTFGSIAVMLRLLLLVLVAGLVLYAGKKAFEAFRS